MAETHANLPGHPENLSRMVALWDFQVERTRLYELDETGCEPEPKVLSKQTLNCLCGVLIKTAYRRGLTAAEAIEVMQQFIFAVRD